jgi:hypothetical protein
MPPKSPIKTAAQDGWSLSTETHALAPRFLERTTIAVEALRPMLAGRNFVGIRLIAGHLKASSPVYGLVALGELGRYLERAAAREDAHTVEHQIAALEAMLTPAPSRG